MSLFISNFNQLMKIILLSSIILLIYNVFIIFYNPKITTFQNQWQKNYSFAQDFIYEKKAPNIIVGSSMAARMNNKFLPNDFFNLSLGGGSSLTGLEIIKKSGYIPKQIYIESNIVIIRDKDLLLIDSLFYPVWWKIKKFILALKEKNQPLNIILSKSKGSYGKSCKEHMLTKRDDQIFNMSIARQKEFYSKRLNNYNNMLNDLKNLIQYFETKGTKVIFFEMPIDNSLALSIKSVEERDVIKKSFNNQWLPLPDNNNFITSDGIHLIYSSAYKFSELFILDTNK